LIINKYNFQANELKKLITPTCKSVLDVGCGKNSNLRFVPKTNINLSVGVDLFKKDLKTAQKSRIHDKYINANILEIDKHISPKSFDCVMAMDVVEHLEKDKAIKLIKMMEKIAAKLVIISTPNGYLPQGIVGGNIYQVHKCGFTPDDLTGMGYSLKGMDGPKFLRHEEAEIRFRPKILFAVISNILDPFFRYFPKASFSLLAYKYIENNA
jgi:SAM-dependent methyltransferase